MLAKNRARLHTNSCRRWETLSKSGLAVLVLAAALSAVRYASGAETPNEETTFPTFRNVQIRYAELQGIGPEEGVVRRDPSDIIRVGDSYFVWYTKVLPSAPAFPEGFGGSIWYATSSDGKNWAEQGRAVGRGKKGKFDEFGVFTPNVLYAPTTNKYYLYYTGVRGSWSPDWKFEDFSGSIGAAVADTPDGGSNGWQRVNRGDPLLAPRPDMQAVFDGWHVDDTVMFFRDQKYWLYYKGHSLDRHLRGTDLPSGATPMGVAVSDRPGGGFVRISHGNRGFLVQPGHELLLWPRGEGICSLPTGHYRPPHADDFRLHYSQDGLQFEVVSSEVSSARQRAGRGLRAPGLFRPDLTEPDARPTLPLWGISMTSYARDAGLQRFEILYDVD